MANFQIGLSALRASQFAMNVAANNLANANTPGFHRQRVDLESLEQDLFQGFGVGRGVTVSFVQRLRHQVIEASLTSSISDLGYVDQKLSIENQIESWLRPGDGSLNERFEAVFNEIVKLTSSPGERVQRNAVVEQGVQLSAQLRRTSNQLFELKTEIEFQIEQEVRVLNADFERLADVQKQILTASANSVPNDLLDRRDQIINKIAGVVDVSRQENYQNGLSLSLANHSIQFGLSPPEITALHTDQGSLSIAIGDLTNPVKLHSGRLAALVELYNETIPEFENRLDQFAGDFIRQFDQVHAMGVGIDSAFATLTGNRAVVDISVPLDQSGAAFSIEPGDLFFSITDPSGNRRTATISIDPQTQSLQDVAQSISGIDNLQAVVNPETGKMQIIAANGYTFDFTGSVETIPVLDAWSGSSIPQFSGNYEGQQQQPLSFQIIGSGTVGVTDGLQAHVFNSAGEIVAELNIGNGYEANSEVALVDGVSIRFGFGDVVNGDSFDTTLVGNSDSSGILSALGLNSFFVGHDAGTIDVDSRIASDPDQFAASRNGDAGDSANLLEFIALRDRKGVDGGRLSFDEYLNEITLDIGIQVQSSENLKEGYQSLKDRFQLERDSYSGVDLNEEALYLAQFQKSYEAAVRVIQTSESMLDELFSVIR